MLSPRSLVGATCGRDDSKSMLSPKSVAVEQQGQQEHQEQQGQQHGQQEQQQEQQEQQQEQQESITVCIGALLQSGSLEILPSYTLSGRGLLMILSRIDRAMS